MAEQLSGKTVLVTGAGPNIGREIALEFARSGARVACNDVDREQAEAAARDVADIGVDSCAAPGDVSDPESVRRMFDEVEERLGAIDVVVNNAAVTIPKGLLDVSVDEWNRCVDVVLTGTFLVSREAAARMVDRDAKGAIVNVASTSGHRGRAGAVGYCAAKGGVLNLTRAMACDLAGHGIRVNSVSPTKTGASVGSIESATARTFGEIPLGRLGAPIDQAKAVCFLASPAAAFITGEDLRVDGGSLATWGTRQPT
jgi:NAD(P)-dependent dehydrogenase (short-subunit alcohol dehydrogenase family)